MTHLGFVPVVALSGAFPFLNPDVYIVLYLHTNVKHFGFVFAYISNAQKVIAAWGLPITFWGRVRAARERSSDLVLGQGQFRLIAQHDQLVGMQPPRAYLQERTDRQEGVQTNLMPFKV